MAIPRAKSGRKWRANSLQPLRRSWRSAHGMPRISPALSKERVKAQPHRTGWNMPRPAMTSPISRSSARGRDGICSRRGRAQAAGNGRRSGRPTRRVPTIRIAIGRSTTPVRDNFGGRTIAAEIDPQCVAGDCRLWIANANGGVWRTDDALAAEPEWSYVSDSFDHNNVAALALDPNDSSSDTLWAGTGEPNACGSGCTAGVGLYLTTNGGESWRGPDRRRAVRGTGRWLNRRAAGQLERGLRRFRARRARACRTPAAVAWMRSSPALRTSASIDR